jgi:hypothetical protein
MSNEPEDQAQLSQADEPLDEQIEEPATPEAPEEPFIPPRHAPRKQGESLFVRLIATAGIVAVGVALAAILGATGVAAWIIGLVVSVVTVVVAAILWSSRTL